MPAVATAAGLPTRLGKYEILTPLATGGMARIYIARTTGIGSFERHVVLKLITPERANDHTAVQMFLDEARLAASLNHQNVAQVFEVGEDAGIHYLAMEYVHGQDLRALLAKAGSQGTRVPLELALTVVAGAAAGLNHAHERRGPDGVPLGIVHRDVSPSNIMIGYDGSVKLLDFGIAKATARSVETQSGIIKGKFAYMAPEQCRGRDVDRRSDVFSLGIILYEITTQHRCFRADSDFDTMHRIVTGDVVRPTRLIQGYPQALEAIVMKALAVDANQRYQSAGLLLEALEQFSVSARMSLSTMALGRFMREMFGETPEPWLIQTGRGSQPPPPQPKESTISNTNGTGSEQHPRPQPQPPVDSSASVQAAASTLLDLPRGRGDGHEPDDPHDVQWHAKSYPQGAPAYAQPVTQPTTSDLDLPTLRTPVDEPHDTEPPPPLSFAPGPGSGSGPAHPAPAMPSTRHGYAGAPQRDLSYPRYEPPVDSAADLRLKPNRRPVFIGLGIVVVGVAVLLAMTIGGSGGTVDTGGSGAASSVAPRAPAPDATEAVVPHAGSADSAPLDDPGADESVSIKVDSDPPGADVLLSGKSIGTTPLDVKVPKGTGSAFLVVHRAKYEDVTTRIDLTGDFEKKVALKKLEDKVDPKAQDAAKKADELRKQQEARDAKLQEAREARKADEQRRQQEAREAKKAEAARQADLKRKELEAARKAEELKLQEAAKQVKAKCQPPGQYNPFDFSCAGQVGALDKGLCPPCK